MIIMSNDPIDEGARRKENEFINSQEEWVEQRDVKDTFNINIYKQ